MNDESISLQATVKNILVLLQIIEIKNMQACAHTNYLDFRMKSSVQDFLDGIKITNKIRILMS